MAYEGTGNIGDVLTIVAPNDSQFLSPSGGGGLPTSVVDIDYGNSGASSGSGFILRIGAAGAGTGTYAISSISTGQYIIIEDVGGAASSNVMTINVGTDVIISDSPGGSSTFPIDRDGMGIILQKISTTEYKIVAAYNENGVTGGNLLIGQTNGLISNPTPVTSDNESWFGNLAGTNSASLLATTLIGARAGDGATAADQSTFIGFASGLNAINATNSVFVGWNSGAGSTDAGASTFIGQSSGQLSINADHSNFFGLNAGTAATNAAHSLFMGNTAGYTATGAEYSIFAGDTAGNAATDAAHSIFIGSSAGATAPLASNSIFIGDSAGLNDLVDNVTTLYIAFTGLTGGTFGTTDTVTSTSGGSATVIGADLNILIINAITGTFLVADTITNGIASATIALSDQPSTILIGHSTSTSSGGAFNNTIAIGNGATSRTNNEVLISSPLTPYTHIALDSSTGATFIGDGSGIGNGSSFVVSDSTETLDYSVLGSSYFNLDVANSIYKIGDIGVINNGTYQTIDDNDGGFTQQSALYGVSQVTTYNIVVRLTAAQIKTANSIPVDIGLPASGNGLYYRVVAFDTWMNFGTTQFTSTDLSIGGTTAITPNAQLNAIGILQSTTTGDSVPGISVGAGGVFSDNDTVSITANADSAVGDSTIDCYITVEKVAL